MSETNDKPKHGEPGDAGDVTVGGAAWEEH